MASSTTTEVAAPAPTAADSPAKTPKKTKATKANVKKPRKLASHPPVHGMISAAIENLKDRKGSSLQAIKKYIASSYTCDVAKLATFIRKALKTGVEKGTFVQTTGTGASGSFKLKAVDRKANKDDGEGKKKKTTKPAGGKKVAKQSSTRKPTGEKKAQKKPVGAKVAKKAGAVKRTTAAPKLTAAKPSKTAVAKPKNARSRKAASVRNVAARK